MSITEKIIVALDMSDPVEAIEYVDKLKDYINVFKVGLELYSSSGPGIVKEIHNRGRKVFLDLKYHDIPNTVSKAAIAATRLGVSMFNLHASGGMEMMKRCRDSVVEICLKENLDKPRILGVTVLTSISREILRDELGISHGVKAQVKHLAALSEKSGLDGVVASAQEASLVRKNCGKGFLIVTPGIRPSWTPPDDQKRVMTPKEAVKEGADYIVMGRGILRHPEPEKALELIALEMLSA
jgi:orotidine-5'-phosphate decarboxylase